MATEFSVINCRDWEAKDGWPQGVLDGFIVASAKLIKT